jgi:hypothetical protein
LIDVLPLSPRRIMSENYVRNVRPNTNTILFNELVPLRKKNTDETLE